MAAVDRNRLANSKTWTQSAPLGHESSWCTSSSTEAQIRGITCAACRKMAFSFCAENLPICALALEWLSDWVCVRQSRYSGTNWRICSSPPTCLRGCRLLLSRTSPRGYTPHSWFFATGNKFFWLWNCSDYKLPVNTSLGFPCLIQIVRYSNPV